MITTMSPMPKPLKYEPLTRAWKPLVVSKRQARFLSSEARFNYIAAGRRSLKTHGARLRLVYRAIGAQPFDDCQYFACGPTHQQTKDIMWEPIKALIPSWAYRVNKKQSISESELRIELWNGAVIRVAGLDKPQRVEGGFWDHGVITEYSDVKEGVFDENIFPMMVRGGSIDIEGVPGGRNHYFRDFQFARKQEMNPEQTEYSTHAWKTADVLHLWLGREKARQELETAKAKLDPLTYRQEYEADFVSMEGAAYYCFDLQRHVRHKLPYNKQGTLCFSFDFNVAPGVAVISQDVEDDDVTYVLGEVYIPRNSNTPAVCRKLIAEWGKHEGPIEVFGDATGGASGTAKVQGSDWDIVKRELRAHFGAGRLTFKVPESNPPERARVNSMNSRLLTTDGTCRMYIYAGCEYLIRDFEGVILLKGGSGEIDKKHDTTLTHLSDALGYKISKKHPVRARETVVQDL